MISYLDGKITFAELFRLYVIYLRKDNDVPYNTFRNWINSFFSFVNEDEYILDEDICKKTYALFYYIYNRLSFYYDDDMIYGLSCTCDEEIMCLANLVPIKFQETHEEYIKKYELYMQTYNKKI